MAEFKAVDSLMSIGEALLATLAIENLPEARLRCTVAADPTACRTHRAKVVGRKKGGVVAPYFSL